MSHEKELWQFINDRLGRDESVVLLVVAESAGSSPGRAGYKMAIASNGSLIGSIGGGVMEVNLVEKALGLLSRSMSADTHGTSTLIEQEHRKNSKRSSGMICSGSQTVIQTVLVPGHIDTVQTLLRAYSGDGGYLLIIDDSGLAAGPDWCGTRTMEGTLSPISFERGTQHSFSYSEVLPRLLPLFIIGGGHCSLALSELMSRLGFRVVVLDDRPGLNTLEKNSAADACIVIDDYASVNELIPVGDDLYIVVMTLGYKTDAVVIRQLLDRTFKYFGVLGSKAKMATLMRELKAEGVDPAKLARIRTPIGIPINSHTPEEIAISIAAEIISVKNA